MAAPQTGLTSYQIGDISGQSMAILDIYLPDSIRECFEKGGFVCNIKGSKMHPVALDEAHEMIVNKDIKTIVNSR